MGTDSRLIFRQNFHSGARWNLLAILRSLTLDAPGLTRQQRNEERKRQEGGQSLPDLKRSALVKCARPPNFGGGARESGLHLERELGHVVIALRRIDRD